MEKKKKTMCPHKSILSNHIIIYLLYGQLYTQKKKNLISNLPFWCRNMALKNAEPWGVRSFVFFCFSPQLCETCFGLKNPNSNLFSSFFFSLRVSTCLPSLTHIYRRRCSYFFIDIKCFMLQSREVLVTTLSCSCRHYISRLLSWVNYRPAWVKKITSSFLSSAFMFLSYITQKEINYSGRMVPVQLK